MKRESKVQRLAIGKFERSKREVENSGLSELDDFHRAQEEMKSSFEPSPSMIFARNLFFAGIKQFVREVLTDLAADALEKYSKARIGMKDQIKSGRMTTISPVERLVWNKTKRLSWRELEIGNALVSREQRVSRLPEAVQELVAIVMEWSVVHNLDHPWCRVAAFETLDLWHHSPVDLEECNWDYQLPLPHSLPNLDGEVFQIRSNFPFIGQRSESVEELVSQFRSWLDDIFDEREVKAKELGYSEATKKPATFDHFNWLAFYQCHPSRPGYQLVGKKFHIGKEGIRDGILSAADVCGLALRIKGPSGRKKSG